MTPYMWDGETCVFAPVCCACAGDDCDDRFATRTTCLRDFSHCDPEDPEADYPDGYVLIWKLNGRSGTGPALLIEGDGLARYWDSVMFEPDPEMVAWDYEEDLGPMAGDALFAALESLDYESVPHDVDECEDEIYPEVKVFFNRDDEPTSVPYCGRNDLVPEFEPVFEWMEAGLCRMLAISDYDEWPIF